MARQALMVLTASDLPDGDLALHGSTTGGWGTLDPVSWRTRGGTAFRPPQIVNGVIVANGTPGTQSMLLVDVPVPRKGRIEWQLGPGVNDVWYRSGGGLINDNQDGIVVGYLDGFVTTMAITAGVPTNLALTPIGDANPNTARIGLSWISDSGTYETWINDVVVASCTGQTRPSVLQPGLILSILDEPGAGAQTGIGFSYLALTAEVDEPPAPARVPTPTDTDAGWSIVAARRNGRRLAEVHPDAVTTTFRLTEPSDVSLTLDGTTPASLVIEELSTDLHVFSDGRRRFRGRVAPSADTLTKDGGHQTTFTAWDTRGILGRHQVWPHFRQRFVSVPAGQVLRSIIGDTQAMPNGDLGIRFPTDHPDGPLVTVTFKPGQPIRSCVDQVITAVPGAAWDVDGDDLFRWWPAGRGTRRDLILEHGRNAVFSRTFNPADYGNAARYGADTEATAQYRWNPDDMARAGRWEISEGDPTETSAPSAAARADAAFAAASVATPAYTATLDPDVWTPGRLGLGDQVRIIVRSGRLDVDTEAVVHEIAASWNADTNEPTVAITFDRPRPSDIRDRARDRRRLRTLERR